MGENSNISWCHHTFNPWIGCDKVSDGCKHCYAEGMQHRFGGGLWGASAKRKLTVDSNWQKPLAWDRKAKLAGERHRVFCSSLADVFEGREDLAEPRRWLFRLIESTPHLDWLLLTKRPHDMARLSHAAGWLGDWPNNVWAGATVENQKAAETRVLSLLDVPARLRFLSCEPLLGMVSLTDIEIVSPATSDVSARLNSLTGHLTGPDDILPHINWVIVGGESGPSARPFELSHAVSLVRQCNLAGVPMFFKQLGARPVLGGDPWPVEHDKRAGADKRDWPEWVTVQEVPR